MRMSFYMQEISDADFSFLKVVYRSTRENELTLMNWTEIQKNNFIEFQFKAQQSYYINQFPDLKLYLIKNNTTKMGRLYIWRNSNEIRIVEITLLPKFQNQGIGSSILKKLIEESDRQKKIITIHVIRENPAIHLYKRFGFINEKEEGIYYFMVRPFQNKMHK